MREARTRFGAVIQPIMALSIAANVGALRMAAIQVAKSSKKLRALYDARMLLPEVQAELPALRPLKPKASKRARLK